jgi:hypothetical protein
VNVHASRTNFVCFPEENGVKTMAGQEAHSRLATMFFDNATNSRVGGLRRGIISASE